MKQILGLNAAWEFAKTVNLEEKIRNEKLELLKYVCLFTGKERKISRDFPGEP